MSDNDMLSTSALAKALGLSSHELFAKFRQDKLIEEVDQQRVLTALGEKIGGAYVESKKFGRYIVWPKSMMEKAPSLEKQSETRLTATSLGSKYELSANKVNSILSELGWIKKAIKGWELTEQGVKQGGVQDENRKSGVPFARWPESIISSKPFLDSVQEVKGETELSVHKKIDFREKFEAKHRSTDGHFVRSKAEMLIDNWLYMAEIIHAYERKLPVEENVYCDFYIPTGKVYIEYWGYENDSKYLQRKYDKIEIYKKYNFNLIELNEDDVKNLDDVLPRLLLKFGVQSY